MSKSKIITGVILLVLGVVLFAIKSEILFYIRRELDFYGTEYKIVNYSTIGLGVIFSIVGLILILFAFKKPNS